ncbi:MAG TPA: 23S rRNA (pseudouridine(1915)-N(3))-methyltransferase RlmH [Gemmatimonadales bacterium]|nr:23S rRNA (pseudouridine(1915)-N(3))-methyltransferase RlmH [Gemmatimonadales bacterium]
MRYRVVAVGRVRDAALRAACDGYLERLRRYTRVEEREVKDEARILEGVPEGSRLVALSEAGEQWSSEQLADWTARWELDGRDVAFAIGGAEALPAAVLQTAERTWSLSRLTFPHELARVIVCEQLYRAYTIRRGEPYHRGS